MSAPTTDALSARPARARRTTRRRAAVALAVVPVLFALPACGGSEDAAPASSSTTVGGAVSSVTTALAPSSSAPTTSATSATSTTASAGGGAGRCPVGSWRLEGQDLLDFYAGLSAGAPAAATEGVTPTGKVDLDVRGDGTLTFRPDLTVTRTGGGSSLDARISGDATANWTTAGDQLTTTVTGNNLRAEMNGAAAPAAVASALARGLSFTRTFTCGDGTLTVSYKDIDETFRAV